MFINSYYNMNIVLNKVKIFHFNTWIIKKRCIFGQNQKIILNINNLYNIRLLNF